MCKCMIDSIYRMYIKILCDVDIFIPDSNSLSTNDLTDNGRYNIVQITTIFEGRYKGFHNLYVV